MPNIIEMPKLSDTMTEGTVVNWLKNEGDKVENGDILAEIETDKATQELECFDDGFLLKIYIPTGGKAPCGKPICAIGEEGEKAPKFEVTPEAKPASKEADPEPSPKETEEEGEAPEPKSNDKTAPKDASKSKKSAPAKATAEPKGKPTKPPAPKPASSSSSQRLLASPLARRIAEEEGIPLDVIKGSGPKGRIVKSDVLAAKEQGVIGSAAAVIPALEEKLTPISNIREVIAKRLLESKTQIPHFYIEKEIDATPLLQVRAAINDRFKKYGQPYRFTVNDYILKAAAEALRAVPGMNASWEGDQIHQHGSIHLAFGVALEDGLVTPVIREAETKDLLAISREARELIDKARSKKLTPEEMSGSTFTVTNLGMFGVDSFYGIINPPNAGILSVGGVFNKPVVDANENIIVGKRMTLGLSCDHRTVDGAIGALFLQALSENLEVPSLMFV